MFHDVSVGITGNEKRTVWVGQYEKYADAQEALDTNSSYPTNLFGVSEWLNRQGALRDRIDPLVTSVETAALPRPTNLPLLVAGGEVRSIVDFGGGSGWVYNACTRLGMDLTDYLVLEIPEVVERFKPLSLGPLQFRKFSEAPLDTEVADVVYSNSALQYARDNQSLCDVISAVSPRWVLLDELLWANTRNDWFSIQVNSDVPIICRFLSLEKLASDLRGIGYQIAWSGSFGGAGGYGFPQMDEFDESHQIVHAMSLLFVKNSAS